MMNRRPRLGLISDTHDLLRPEAVEILEKCEAILHAGDICKMELLDSLRALGCVVAVRGNNDHDDRLRDLPESQIYDWRGVRILLVHDRSEITTVPPDVDVVVYGHSHKPKVTEEPDGRMYVNPGSAGRRRFRNPVSLATLEIGDDDKVHVEIHEIAV